MTDLTPQEILDAVDRALEKVAHAFATDTMWCVDAKMGRFTAGGEECARQKEMYAKDEMLTPSK